jgi:predicted NBD/HSP70 family sugar kinase
LSKYSTTLRKGANQSTIKNANRSLVLEALNSYGTASRTDLARITGLTKTSITNITTELLEQGVICETDPGGGGGGGIGRNPVMLEIAQGSPLALGFSINRDFGYFSLINLKGDIVREDMLFLHDIETAEAFLDGIMALCEKQLSFAKEQKKRVIGIGIASIGPIDIRKGEIANPPNSKVLKDIPIVDRIKERFRLPVVLNNDMNASALAEKLFGCGKRLTNFVYLGVTNGIGAGVVLDKRLLMGENGFAAEVGHISIDYKGKPCPCGNVGCLERYAGIPAIEEHAREVAGGQASLLSLIPSIRWFDIVDAARKQDKVALAILDDLTGWLTAGMVAIANAYDPEVIFIGHELAVAGDFVVGELERRINERVFSKGIQKVKVQLSGFADKMYRINGPALLANEYFRGNVQI